jgi:hypothetical protein
MSGNPRNQPCPCGSGRKYKRCCLGQDEAERAEAVDLDWANVDLRVTHLLATHHPGAMARARDCQDDLAITGTEYLAFWTQMVAWDAWLEDGKRAAARVVSAAEHEFDPRERRYMRAQLDAWLSIWRVVDVTPGSGLVLVDALTGVERSVRERIGSHDIGVGDGLLARIVRKGAGWEMFGLYPHVIPAEILDETIGDVRWHLSLGDGEVHPYTLMGEQAFGVAEITIGQILVAREDAEDLTEFVDAAGNPVRLVEDTYEFPAEARGALLEALEDLEGVVEDEEPPEGDDDEGPATSLILLVPGSDSIVADLEIRARLLRVAATSIERADDARGILEGLDAPSLVHVGRITRTLDELLEAARLAEDMVKSPLPPEALAHVRSMKARHYAGWIDEQIPALDGRTPREVAREPGSKQFVTLLELLEDIDETESGGDPAQRFDTAELREVLGLSAE